MNKDNSNIDYGAALDKIKANPFNPNMTEHDIGQIFGYSQCLHHLSNYLHVVTEYKPENRRIDAVPLIDGISKAFGEIRKLLEKAKEVSEGEEKPKSDYLHDKLNFSDDIPDYPKPLNYKP